MPHVDRIVSYKLVESFVGYYFGGGVQEVMMHTFRRRFSPPFFVLSGGLSSIVCLISITAPD